MAVFIGSNTISSLKKRLAVDDAIRKAIGEREGTWRVSVAESGNKNVWNLVVKGPDGFYWGEHFDVEECTPAHVEARIRADLEHADAELSIALADLVKQGVMFSREIRPDGAAEYVFDRVRLSGDEVKHLRNHGALTRRGIEQYLTARK